MNGILRKRHSGRVYLSPVGKSGTSSAPGKAGRRIGGGIPLSAKRWQGKAQAQRAWCRSFDYSNMRKYNDRHSQIIETPAPYAYGRAAPYAHDQPVDVRGHMSG